MPFRPGGAAAAPAEYPQKRRRVGAPWCPSPVLLAAALVCLTTATTSALPGAAATSRTAISVGDGDRRISWRDTSRKSGHPSQQPLQQEARFVGSPRRGASPAEALRVRGGGRPLFTGHKDTTESAGPSSEASETTGYDGSSTEDADAAESESEGGHMTGSESSAWQHTNRQGVEEGGRGHEGNCEEGEDEGSDMFPASRALAEDLYARTFGRRMALALTSRVTQRALMRTAFLLVALQVSPWLRHHFIAQLVLVGSLMLQTSTEMLAAARAVKTSGTQVKGDLGQEGSRAEEGPGNDGSPPSIPPPSLAGLIRGIREVFSPENKTVKQFDFESLSDIFHNDVRDVAVGSQSKQDVPNLLATGGRMMKSSKGLASGNNERVFVVSFRPGHVPDETEEQQMDLLSATSAFLAAYGNTTTDEVVVMLDSEGGDVSAFGLAATKLARLREKGFKLTVCVDKVAASGGYMMACVADKLVVAPYATLGPIGVVVDITPNFNQVLKKNGVEPIHGTAGQRKSPVGPYQQVTKKAYLSAQKKLTVATHRLVRAHVQRYRPSVNVEAIDIWEVWRGQDAVELGLADEVGVAAEYLQSRMANARVLMVKQYKEVVGHRPSSSLATLRGLLSVASNVSSRVSAIARIATQVQDVTAGGVYGAPSRPVTGEGDSLTRSRLGKDFARVADLHGLGLHGTGAGTRNGGSWGVPSLGGAGYSPVFRGVEWENGSGADLPGGNSSSHEAAVGEEKGGFWVF